MGAPLRKPRIVANDARPPVRMVPPSASPRIVAYVRLAPMPETRRNFSWAAALACVFLALTIFLLGIVAGTVFWFTYDARASAPVTAPPPMPVVIRGRLPLSALATLAPVPVPLPSPPPPPDSADITLPASSLLPPESETPHVVRENGLELSVRDATPEEAGDTPDDGGDIPAAKILAQRGELQEAIARLERAVRAAPGDMSRRFDLAILYDRARRAREALMLYRQVIEAAEDGVPQEISTPLSPETLAALRARADYLEGLEGE